MRNFTFVHFCSFVQLRFVKVLVNGMVLRGEFNNLLAFVISNTLWLPLFAKIHIDAFSLITLFAFGSA